MSNSKVGRTTIVHKDDFAYISHPSITRLDNGAWIAAFNHSRRREPRQHPPGDPLFRTLVTRTSDLGETWGPPTFAPDFDWYGTECPGIAQPSDGTVVLTETRMAWYPLGLAKRQRDEGKRIAIHLPERGWTEAFEDSDWADASYTWARGEHGLYAHLSTDLGETFEETVKIETGPFQTGFTRTGVVELQDGRVAYAVTEHLTPHYGSCYVVFSTDFARSWSPPVTVVDRPEVEFSEPHLAEVGPGELYYILRESRSSGHLYGCRSSDGGSTWSIPEQTSIYGHPGHLLVLEDGRLLCSYGRRKEPFGIRACISEDGGRSWKVEREIVIRHDLPNGDLGYPTTIEYEPGKLFCCYYGQEPDGVTCVQGTYFSLE